MKKSLLVAIICALTATSPLFGQHTQSLSLSNPGPLNGATGQTFAITVSLTFSGYSSFGLSYWLEVPNALAPFLSIASKTHFTFPDPNQPIPAGAEHTGVDRSRCSCLGCDRSSPPQGRSLNKTRLSS